MQIPVRWSFLLVASLLITYSQAAPKASDEDIEHVRGKAIDQAILEKVMRGAEGRTQDGR